MELFDAKNALSIMAGRDGYKVELLVLGVDPSGRVYNLDTGQELDPETLEPLDIGEGLYLDDTDNMFGDEDG